MLSPVAAGNAVTIKTVAAAAIARADRRSFVFRGDE
jgi:hypothetical protein